MLLKVMLRAFGVVVEMKRPAGELPPVPDLASDRRRTPNTFILTTRKERYVAQKSGG